MEVFVHWVPQSPGRGAMEIDILEVLPGTYAPDYKKEKARRATPAAFPTNPPARACRRVCPETPAKWHALGNAVTPATGVSPTCLRCCDAGCLSGQTPHDVTRLWGRVSRLSQKSNVRSASLRKIATCTKKFARSTRGERRADNTYLRNLHRAIAQHYFTESCVDMRAATYTRHLRRETCARHVRGALTMSNLCKPECILHTQFAQGNLHEATCAHSQ